MLRGGLVAFAATASLTIFSDALIVNVSGPVEASVEALVNRQKDTFESIASQIDKLESKLHEMHNDKVETMRDKKHFYHERLEQQHQESMAVASDTLQMIGEVDRLRKGNKELQQKAKNMLKSNEALKTSLLALRGNLSVAGLYAQKSIESMTSFDAEVKILDELVAVDEQKKKEQAKQKSVDEILAPANLRRVEASDSINEMLKAFDFETESYLEPAGKASFLQLRHRHFDHPTTDSKVAAQDPESQRKIQETEVTEAVKNHMNDVFAEEKAANSEIDKALQKVAINLDDLKRHQVESSDNLENVFDKMYSKGKHRAEELLEERKSITELKRKLEGVQNELTIALKDLEEQHEYLLKQKKALSGYMMKLASMATPNAISGIPSVVQQ